MNTTTPNSEKAEPVVVLPQPVSLRDWFAGQALAGMFANQSYDEVMPVDMALQAYGAADAMLAERAKAEGGQ